MVSGISAGGMAAFTWVDYIADRVRDINPNAKFYGIPDSGIFLDFENRATHTMDYRSII